VRDSRCLISLLVQTRIAFRHGDKPIQMTRKDHARTIFAGLTVIAVVLPMLLGARCVSALSLGTEPIPTACTQADGYIQSVEGKDPVEFASGCTAFNFAYYQFSRSLGVLHPRSNQRHCTDCHSLHGSPATLNGIGTQSGQLSNIFYLRDGETAPEQHHTWVGTIHEFNGGSLPGITPLPDRATVMAVKSPTMLGIGRLDAMPNSVFEALADPNDADGDGISGRVVYVSGKAARFGVQNQHSSLRAFVEQAFEQELGFDPEEIVAAALGKDPSFLERLGPCGMALVNCVTRFLAATELAEPQGGSFEFAYGRALFDQVNCSGCHTPDLGGIVGWYSDELLHDMGEDLMSLNPDALPSELATPSLRHVSRSSPWMRGRATNLTMAILLHSGPEVQTVMEDWLDLTVSERNAIITFLYGI
jgi:hypothetical protein